jgi:hypothetical protein
MIDTGKKIERHFAWIGLGHWRPIGASTLDTLCLMLCFQMINVKPMIVIETQRSI